MARALLVEPVANRGLTLHGAVRSSMSRRAHWASRWRLPSGIRRGVLAVAAAMLASACGDDEEFRNTEDVAGTYDLTIRNADNGCQFENWEEDGTATDIGLQVSQTERELHGQLVGVGGGVVAVLIGTAEFEGGVAGNDVTLEGFSGYVRQEGNCTYNLRVTLNGTLNGNVMSGTLRYTFATNDAPDCTDLEACESIQTFDAVRTASE